MTALLHDPDTLPSASVHFDLPPGRHATAPPERRGLAREEVRLLVARPDGITHTRFGELGDHLEAGDVLVVNTSHTRPSAIDGDLDGRRVVVHLATRQSPRRWTVELRRPDGAGPILDGAPGAQVRLAGGAVVDLGAPATSGPEGEGVRLWHATLTLPSGLSRLLEEARPITYGVDAPHHPLSEYQTVFARPTGPGSAEMASAGRPFSRRLVTDLVSRGIVVVPITLHAGVSSQDAGEPPQQEWFDVPAATVDAVTSAHRRGRRVIAVGTTVTRALESASGRGGLVAQHGWTDLVITPDRGTAVVDGLITGWHEVQASHLLLLEAVGGRSLVQAAYEAAVAGPYLWHEFGDSCLLLP